MADPIIVKTIRDTVGLRAAGTSGEHEALAVYRSMAGEEIFAICRDGLLLMSGGIRRYVGHGEIADLDLQILKVKSETASRELLLTLTSGEDVELSVDGERDGYLDIFQVYAFLRRRIHQHRRLGGR
jgi:hypothetical protein